eukprot:SAG25_NODE_2089_length_1964_cov_13.859517_3_plen_96_part_00
MALAHRGTRWTCLGRGGYVDEMAAPGRDALVLARHRYYDPELTAPRPPPAFPLLLESRAYAGRAERVGVSGGVDEHHTRAGHPLSRIYHTHIPRA